jgi:hypothetical protein
MDAMATDHVALMINAHVMFAVVVMVKPVTLHGHSLIALEELALCKYCML